MKYRCPQCGSSEGLWLPVECSFEEGVDCTECDHMGPIADYEVAE